MNNILHILAEQHKSQYWTCCFPISNQCLYLLLCVSIVLCSYLFATTFDCKLFGVTWCQLIDFPLPIVQWFGTVVKFNYMNDACYCLTFDGHIGVINPSPWPFVLWPSNTLPHTHTHSYTPTHEHIPKKITSCNIRIIKNTIREKGRVRVREKEKANNLL